MRTMSPHLKVLQVSCSMQSTAPYESSPPLLQRLLSMQHGWVWTWTRNRCGQTPASSAAASPAQPSNLLSLMPIQDLLWVAREGLKAKLPPDWKPWWVLQTVSHL